MDLFILPSGSEYADVKETAESFEGIPFFYKQVSNLQAIIDEEIDAGWYMIMYDDEYIDDNMAKAIPIYLLSQFEVLECYKRTDDKVGTISPRLFRENIKPQRDSLLPANIKELKTSRILDGWIKPHVQV